MDELLVLRPDSPLASAVECIWYFRGSRPTREVRLPSASAGIVFSLGKQPLRIFESEPTMHGASFRDAVVTGPYSHQFVLDEAAEAASSAFSSASAWQGTY
jgi:hypothetical protein